MKDNKMKTSHIFWGTLFIVLGLLVFINNFTPIYVDWGTIWKLWPLVIILIGISILIKHRYGKGVVAGLAALILAFSIFASFKSAVHFFNTDFDMVFDEGKTGSGEIQYFAEDFDSIKTKAVFNFDAGAGSFQLTKVTDQLVEAQIESRKHSYEIIRTSNDSSDEVSLEMQNTRFNFGGQGYVNRVDLSLNPLPVWDLNFAVGAAKIKLDLTELKIQNLNVDMGAASIEVKVGEMLNETNVNIEAGASEIIILVPQNSGCEVNTSDALSSKKLDDFKKIDSGHYQTENFDSSQKKIYIDIECGVSAISVKKY